MISRKRNSALTTDITNKDRIAGIRETIKVDEYLIHYYQDLINPDHPTCSFQIYLRELDAKINVLRQSRKDLIASYDKASNGQISSLQQQNVKLEERLKKLKVNTKVEGIRTKKRKTKINDIRTRLAKLEKELCGITQMDIEELLSNL